jgi:uncharacterized protein (DUF1697 family)
MDRFIALYRGINVGGRNVVRMELLRAMHEQLGHRDVASFIQSGNIVFAARGALERIAEQIAKRFAGDFGFEARVLVLPRSRWEEIAQANPYAEIAARQPKTVHIGICTAAPCVADLQALHARVGGREAFVVRDDVVYLHAPDGFGTSKFAAGMEKACGVPLTVRNWRTVEALWKMLNA